MLEELDRGRIATFVNENAYFLKFLGKNDSVVQAGYHHTQQIDRQSALQTFQEENNNRIPFTFHPQNQAVKSIILKNFNYFNFSQKCIQTSNQPGTFKCARERCETCPFICNVEKLSGPKRSIKIAVHFTCTSANVIYCRTCTLCKLYIGERERRLGDRFREHFRDVE